MKKYTNNILILFAHPALQKSRVNRRLIRYVRDIDGVAFNDLYEEYPDFNINVAREQELLIKNDIVVFHHPIFWFSMPAILKEWLVTKYHSPKDDVTQSLQYETGVQHAKFAFVLGHTIATEPQRPRWNKDDFFGSKFSRR